MQETLYDTDGNAIAYINWDDGGIIYLWNGVPVAYLYGSDMIYGFNGSHLGWYVDGVVWNLKGMKAGFNKQTCPVMRKTEPLKSLRQLKPLKSLRQLPNYRPVFSYGFSNESLAQILSRGRM
ncbi:MAG: hypothetical protein IKS65_05435 [Bacteroidales bacterium]|nr:hypothetical protein [Bacteroidales bacterium]